MPVCVRYTLILWADNFVETVAVLFTSELREAGIRVKLISLSWRPTKGKHGLALVPDLTLSQAIPLLPQTLYLIIPAPLHTLRRLQNDPRLGDFFEQVYTNRLKVLVAPGETFEDEKGCFPGSTLSYPADIGALVDYIQEMVSIDSA